MPKNVVAKTGSMSGIACLCGYTLRESSPGVVKTVSRNSSQNEKVFVIMANSFAPTRAEIFNVIDNFITKQLGEK